MSSAFKLTMYQFLHIFSTYTSYSVCNMKCVSPDIRDLGVWGLKKKSYNHVMIVRVFEFDWSII